MIIIFYFIGGVKRYRLRDDDGGSGTGADDGGGDGVHIAARVLQLPARLYYYSTADYRRQRS